MTVIETNLNLVWHVKVLLIKNECNVVLQSSKHAEITVPHEFIFEFTSYTIWVILSKKCCQRWGVQKKYIKGYGHIRVLFIEEGGFVNRFFKPSVHYIFK